MWIFSGDGNDGINDTRNTFKADGQRHGILFLPIKAVAVASGVWSVKGTGDGVALHEWEGVTGGAGTGSGGAYDVWTSHGPGSGAAGDVSNPLAWCVLENDNGDQILLQGTSSVGVGWDAYGNVFYLPGGGYSPTGISPTTPPATVAGEIRQKGNTRGSSGNQLINFSGAAYLYVAFDDEEREGQYRWLWAVWNDQSNAAHDLNGLMTLTGGPDDDTAPWFLLGFRSAGGPAGNAVFSLYEIQSEGLGAERTFSTGSFDGACLTTAYIPDGLPPDPFTGDNLVVTMPYTRYFGDGSNEYFAGVMDELFARGDNSVDYPDYFDHEGVRYVHFYRICLPWGYVDDSPPDPVSTAGGTGTDSGVVVLNIGVVEEAAPPVTPPDATPPTVTLVSPLDRRVDPGEAIVFDVTDNIGAFARIVFAVAFPSLGVTELVHDGAVFVDAFTAGSTRVAISNGWRYSLTRSGGWPASPRARVFVTDGSGNNES